ncbi:MAG TPA: ATP-binding protein [Acidimicrobiales bacterium]|nr:ATP-binding protein [Acidimicrobiales bacterium]
MRLAADEQAAVEARRFARSWSVRQALSPRLVDDIELVVAELVSNAVRHASPPFEVELSEIDGVIRGEVSDGSRVAPVANPRPDHHGGFGLGIVIACTSRWGTTSTTSGKQVWFEISNT